MHLAANSVAFAIRRRAATASIVASSSAASSALHSSAPSHPAETGALRNGQRRNHPRKTGTASVQQRRCFAADTVYKFGVSPENLETVKATLPLVGEAGTGFTKHFYSRLFAAHPELKNVFNQTNQALGNQPKKLLKTVAIAAQSAIETGELPGEAIEGICQKHAALGVGKEAYDVVGEHLLGTIEDLLTDDAAVLGAWGQLYGDIAGVFTTREREIANEAAKIPGNWTGRRTFELAEKEKLSHTIARFKFKPVDGLPTPAFAPGAYTTIWAGVDDEKGVHGTYTEQPRHYTLAFPRDGQFGHGLSISVKKEGLVSRIIHKAEIGSQWDLSAPFGCFNMSGVEQLWTDEVDAPIVFISAGVGITPVLAMLENIYTTRPATWLHAAINGDVHAYRDRLREISAVRAGDMQRRVWYEDPTPKDGVPGGEETSPHLFNIARYHYKGRMDLEDTRVKGNDELLHLDNPNTRYFMCGPPPFMDVQRESLLSMGVSGDRIHWEGF